MHPKPHIEVLLASYNGENYIEAQIDSILNQSYTNFHLIIRDDGSTDKTREIISKKMAETDKITLLPPSGNKGVIQNFAELMEYSTAPYIMLSDQDDIWFVDKIEKTLLKMHELEQSLKNNTDPILIHTDLHVVDQDLKSIAPSFSKFVKITPEKTPSLYNLLGQNVVTGCTSMMNRALLQSALPIPQDVIMHDWWLALTAAAFGHIGYLNEATMFYRQHSNNQIGAKNGNLIKMIMMFLKDRKKYVDNATKMLNKQQIQASALITKYGLALSKSKIQQIEAFIEWTKGSFTKKIIITSKHGFVKKGVIKNLGALMISLMKN